MRTAIRKTWSGVERDGIGVEVYCGARPQSLISTSL